MLDIVEPLFAMFPDFTNYPGEYNHILSDRNNVYNHKTKAKF